MRFFPDPLAGETIRGSDGFGDTKPGGTRESEVDGVIERDPAPDAHKHGPLDLRNTAELGSSVGSRKTAPRIKNWFLLQETPMNVTRDELERRLDELVARGGEDDPDQELYIPALTTEAVRYQEKKVTLHINSAVRDPLVHPNPGDFVVYLQEEITNVTEAQIVQAKITLTEPGITYGRNDRILFGLEAAAAQPATIYDCRIPPGSYHGLDLERELRIKMNLAYHLVAITAGTKFMNYENGLVYDDDDATIQSSVNILIVHYPPRDMFVFQVVNATNIPVVSPVLYLYVRQVDKKWDYHDQIDDPWDVLGFDRAIAVRDGTFDARTGSYFIRSDYTAPSGGFGGRTDSQYDYRWRHTLSSNLAASTKSADYAIVSIDALNDGADIVKVVPPPINKLYTGPMMGLIYLEDSSATRELSTESSSKTFPVHKVYTSPIPRINRLGVRLFRPDGQIMGFNNADWSIVLLLTVLVAAPTLEFAPA